MKDYIEREAILQYAEKMYALAQKRVREGNTESDVWKATHETQMNERKEFVDLLQSAPAADVVEVRHGRWMTTDAYPHHLYCSVCYKTYAKNAKWVNELDLPTNYCPNCGARMDKEDEHGTD